MSLTVSDIVMAVSEGKGTAAAQQLLAMTGARAAGLWKRSGDALHQLGIAAVPELHAGTQAEFAALTRLVPLSTDGLGIVQAARKRELVMARRSQGPLSLFASASWLNRFDAACSISSPCLSPVTGEVVGVVAIAHVDLIDSDHPAWQQVVEVSRALGEELA